MKIKCPKCGREEMVLESLIKLGESIKTLCICGKTYETSIPKGIMRQFNTGATRDTDVGKNDYEGFLSPLVIETYGNYMTKHRTQVDGKLRDSDNWQKGLPKEAYMKSAWRHFLDVWFIHRGYKRIDKQTGKEITMEDALCALFFNIQGYLHEYLKNKKDNRPFIITGK